MKIEDVRKRVLAGKRIREKSRKLYNWAFDSYLKYSDEFPTDAGMVNEWLNMVSDGHSDQTVFNLFFLMKSAGNYIKKVSGRNEHGQYKFYNPFEDAETPSVKAKQARIFSKDELMLIVKACRNEFEMALIGMLIESGCRISECRIYGRDIFATYFITVEDNKSMDRKFKTGERKYDLTPALSARLKQMAGGDNEPVFKGRNGKMIGDKALNSRVREIIKRAGIKGRKVGAHTIRHTIGTMVAMQNLSVLEVMDKLQHDDIKTSMKYIHLAEKEKRERISTLGLLGIGQDKPVEVEQGYLDKSVVIVDNEPVEVINEVDLIADMFPQIPDGVSIRPKLGEKELNLLRSLMVGYARAYRGNSEVYESQSLLKRMLQKVS